MIFRSTSRSRVIMRPVLRLPRSIKNTTWSFFLTLLLAALVAAQTDRAEVIFAEARSLAASPETVERSFAKFDEAAALFRAVKKDARVADVQLEHGRTLRLHAVSHMNAERWVEALRFFEL